LRWSSCVAIWVPDWGCRVSSILGFTE